MAAPLGNEHHIRRPLTHRLIRDMQPAALRVPSLRYIHHPSLACVAAARARVPRSSHHRRQTSTRPWTGDEDARSRFARAGPAAPGVHLAHWVPVHVLRVPLDTPRTRPRPPGVSSGRAPILLVNSATEYRYR